MKMTLPKKRKGFALTQIQTPADCFGELDKLRSGFMLKTEEAQKSETAQAIPLQNMVGHAYYARISKTPVPGI